MAVDYRAQGKQTKLTDLVYKHADKARNMIIEDPAINALPEPLISIHKTCKYIFSDQLPIIEGYNPNPKTKRDKKANYILKESIFRKRDLDQILREGYYPTCSDIGLIFRGLMIAQKIPTAYVETFHEDYLFGRSFHTHVLGRVFLDDCSVLVNPGLNKIYYDEADIFPYIIFREGLDCWDVGIHSYDDIDRLRSENLAELLDIYEVNLNGRFEKVKGIFEEKRSDLKKFRETELKNSP